MDVSSIYEVPLSLEKEGLGKIILDKLGIKAKEPDLERWEKINSILMKPTGEVKISIVGKYVDLKESYKSLTEALIHGGIGNNINIKFNWVDAEELEIEDGLKQLKNCDGILVPGGFGDRGIEGKINAVRFAREK